MPAFTSYLPSVLTYLSSDLNNISPFRSDWLSPFVDLFSWIFFLFSLMKDNWFLTPSQPQRSYQGDENKWTEGKYDLWSESIKFTRDVFCSFWQRLDLCIDRYRNWERCYIGQNLRQKNWKETQQTNQQGEERNKYCKKERRINKTGLNWTCYQAKVTEADKQTHKSKTEKINKV